MSIYYYLGEAGGGEVISEEFIQDKFAEYENLTEEELEEKSDEYGFDIEEFAEYLTGMNLDEYADLSCDVLKEVYNEELEQGGDIETLFSYLAEAPRGNGYQRYYTFYRALNIRLDKELCEQTWVRDNKEQVATWVEEGDLEAM